MAKKKAGKSKSTGSTNPNADVVVWTGNVRQPTTGLPNDAIVARLSNVSTVSGGATGVIIAINNLGVTNCTDWASYANEYDEFRVLGFELDYLPHYPGGNATVVHSAGFRVETHSSDALTGQTNDTLVQRSDWMPFYTGVAFKEQWKMDGTEEAQYLSTGSPGSVVLGTIYAGAFGASSTSQYGLAVGTFAVQFRGRK